MNEILAKLISVGTPAELVAEVAMELALARTAAEALEARRESDRRRSADRRSRDKATSRDITGDHAMSAESREVTKEAPLSPSPSLPPPSPQPPPQTHPHPHTPGYDIPRARKADRFPCPQGVDEIDWDALKANRRTKRAALSTGAHRRIISKL